MTIDSLDYLFTRPPGSAVLAMTESGVAFLCREDRAGAESYPTPCPVEIRLHAWTFGRVVPAAFLCRLAGRDTGTFETWANAHDAGGFGPAILASLMVQSEIVVQLWVTPDKPARSLRSPNLLKQAAADLRAAADAVGPWTMGEFDAARREAEVRYPSVAALWAAGNQESENATE